MLRQQKFLALAVLVLCLMAVAPAWAEEVKGTIKSVDKDNAKIVVTADGKDLTMKVRDACKITLNGEKAELGDLKAGQKVTVTCKTEDEEHIAQEVAAEKAEG